MSKDLSLDEQISKIKKSTKCKEFAAHAGAGAMGTLFTIGASATYDDLVSDWERESNEKIRSYIMSEDVNFHKDEAIKAEEKKLAKKKKLATVCLVAGTIFVNIGYKYAGKNVANYISEKAEKKIKDLLDSKPKA